MRKYIREMYVGIRDRKYIREMYVGERGWYDLGLRWEQWMNIHSRRSFYFLKNLLKAIKLFS